MKYRVERNERGEWIVLMQCDFEDKYQFEVIAKNSQYRILYDNKDVTKKYKKRTHGNNVK